MTSKMVDLKHSGSGMLTLDGISLVILLCHIVCVVTQPTSGLSNQNYTDTKWNRSTIQGHCPEPLYCRCNWKKRAVSCGKNITYIPIIPPNSQRLYMDGAYLPSIDSDTLANLTHARLLYFGLRNCGLKRVKVGAFEQVAFLENSTLSISDNSDNIVHVNDIRRLLCSIPPVNVTKLMLDRIALTYLPPGIFNCLANTSITYLSLRGNNLTFFSGKVFSPTITMQSLRLDYNSVEFVEMVNMASVRNLMLNWNKLTKPPSCYSQGTSLCPNLETLQVSHNSELNVLAISHFRGYHSLVKLQLRSNNIEKLGDNLIVSMSKLQHLDLQQNKIRQISETALKSKTLQFVDFTSNRFHLVYLKNIAIFNYCPELETLILTDNSLARLSSLQKTFKPLANLKNLYLDNTALTKIPYGILDTLPSLEKLVLTGNTISQWEVSIFMKANRLRSLYLDGNKIAVVNKTSFPGEFLAKLEKLNLGGNYFSCTCDLLWFRNWLDRTNVTIVGLHTKVANYRCHTPQNLAGKPLLQYRPTEKECTLVNMYIVVGASLAGVAAFVTIIGVIAVRYRMHIRYFYFLLRSRMKQYTKLDDITDYCYDAFVVYSSEDREWVLRKLLPRIEHHEGYKLSLYDRDFIPGRDIIDNVMEHMESSRMVIVVLSDNFAESEWCKWELTMAQNKLLDERKDILILVKLDEIRPENLNRRLMLLMREKVYIDWSDSDLGQEMFWKRLVSSLARPPASINA